MTYSQFRKAAAGKTVFTFVGQVAVVVVKTAIANADRGLKNQNLVGDYQGRVFDNGDRQAFILEKISITKGGNNG